MKKFSKKIKGMFEDIGVKYVFHTINKNREVLLPKGLNKSHVSKLLSLQVYVFRLSE